MTETIHDRLPQLAIAEAIRIIENQGSTPKSPGEWRNGEIALCAGAALAAAGLRVTNQFARLSKFEAEIVGGTKSKEPIRRVFKELGWSLDVCNRTIVENDSLPPVARKVGMVCFLQHLPANNLPTQAC